MKITIDTNTIARDITDVAFMGGLITSNVLYHRPKYKIQEMKSRRAEKRYDKMIKASQDKIGPYKPATMPVQVWA